MTVRFLVIQAMMTEAVHKDRASFACTEDQSSMVHGCSLGYRRQARHPFNPLSGRSLRHQYGVYHVDCAVRRCNVSLDDGGPVDQNLASYDLDRDRLTV